jgi:DNA-binding transcriptional regulator YiaG
MSETTTGWPTLTGTPKQIAWATDIRRTKVAALVAALTRDLAGMPGAERITAAYVAAALRPTDAGQWINLRRDPATPANILTYHATPADRDHIRALTRRAADLGNTRDQIATLRQRGLTVRQIAERAGVHTCTIYRWAAGRQAPSQPNSSTLDELETATRPVPAWKKRIAR